METVAGRRGGRGTGPGGGRHAGGSVPQDLAKPLAEQGERCEGGVVLVLLVEDDDSIGAPLAKGLAARASRSSA